MTAFAAENKQIMDLLKTTAKSVFIDNDRTIVVLGENECPPPYLCVPILDPKDRIIEVEDASEEPDLVEPKKLKLNCFFLARIVVDARDCEQTRTALRMWFSTLRYRELTLEKSQLKYLVLAWRWDGFSNILVKAFGYFNLRGSATGG